MKPIALPLILTLFSISHSAQAQEPAQTADSFVNSIGVCTHWSYGDTPYGYAYDRVKQLLGEMGIRNIRDGYQPRELDLYKTYGIKTTTIFGPGATPPAEQIKVLKDHIPAVGEVEGPNEVDIFHTTYEGKPFPEGPRDYQNDLYAAIKADPATANLGVIALSTAMMGSNLKLAPVRSLDYTAMHSYAGGGTPLSSLAGHEVSNMVNSERILGPGAVLKRIIATECGYHTALGNTGTAQPGVSEKAQAKYIPRTYTEYFNHGVVREFTYEFLDEFPDYKTSEREATNAEACFGLLRHDLTPKPAYTSAKNLLTVLNDANWNTDQQQWETKTFQPQSLGITLKGNVQNVHHTLLQKSNGDFYILLWQEVPSFDTRAKQDIANPDVPVTIWINRDIRIAESYRPSLSAAPSPLSPLITSSQPCTLLVNVPDEVIVVRLVPATPISGLGPEAPTALKSTTGIDGVTLSWKSAGRNTAGYFVSRLGMFLGRTAAPRFTDPNVQPGNGYPYTIQAYDRAGRISPGASVVAMTPLIYPDLVVTNLTWTPANPRPGDAVTFAAAIKNIGPGPTPPNTTIGVAFQVDGANANWSDTSNTPLLPGATRILKANNGIKGTPTWIITPGAHTITAYVDDVNRITETNEDNNKLDKTLGP